MATAAFAGLGVNACRGRSDWTAGRLGGPGVQLYTVRSHMERDVAATLREVSAVGYREVETAGLFGLSPQQFRAALDGADLVTPAAHIAMDVVRREPAAALEGARVLGQQWVVVPWLDPAERTAEGYGRAAEDLNRFGAAAQEHGIRVAYHNHEFEFEPLPDGRTGYDVLLSETDPSLVDIELDLFWAVKGGRDPIALFAEHPGRFALCHVKDMSDIAGSQTMVPVGAGEIDFAAIFARAEQAGLRHFFVEHDNPSDPLESIRTSLEHLQQISF